MTAVRRGFLSEVMEMSYNCADSYTTVPLVQTTDLVPYMDELHGMGIEHQ